jgi:hypothetical protein
MPRRVTPRPLLQSFFMFIQKGNRKEEITNRKTRWNQDWQIFYSVSENIDLYASKFSVVCPVGVRMDESTKKGAWQRKEQDARRAGVDGVYGGWRARKLGKWRGFFVGCIPAETGGKNQA